MSYTVLARKFRSRTFDEVIGQEAVTTTLKNAIAGDRVHHGYLFCGTRGVGKTSMARILAKALNCLAFDKPTATPCGECDSCKGIARGEDIDVVEIDAASHTGVDNIRDLRSNAAYRPARARFKIYIIDEVHMLSGGAFNALLKTLEEPPAHVKFIFATTEVQKIPATILSRVQRFDFKSIPAAKIAEHIVAICREENVQIEEAAAKRIARLATGSMRDALSLLDQIISVGGGAVTAQIVDELLPATHDELYAELIDRLAASDAAGAIEVVDRSLGQGQPLDNWCSLLIGQIRDLMVLRVSGAQTDLVDVPAALRPQLVEQCKKFDSGAYVYMISVLEELRERVKRSGQARALIEAAIIRLAEAAKFSSIEALLGQVRAGGAVATPTAAVPQSTQQPVTPPPTGRPMTNPRPESSSSAAKPMQSTPSPRPYAAAPAPMPSTTASSAQPVRRPTSRTTQDDLRAARAEPIVQQALELFGGNIVEARREDRGAPKSSIENGEGREEA